MTTDSGRHEETVRASRRPQNRLLFWFAAALTPDAMPIHLETSPAMAEWSRMFRRTEANDADGAHRTAA